MTGSVRVDFAGAQAPADFEARDARQHPVEDHEVGRIFGEAQLGLVAALDILDRIAFRLEVVAQQQRQIRFVLDDQDTGDGTGSRTDDVIARLVHLIAPVAAASMSVPCRPCGRSAGIVEPVTR